MPKKMISLKMAYGLVYSFVYCFWIKYWVQFKLFFLFRTSKNKVGFSFSWVWRLFYSRYYSPRL